MDTITEGKVRQLADALTAVSKPLLPLFEYAHDFERHLTNRDELELSCIAALLRARAAEARREIAISLEAVEEAASRVATSK